MQKKEEAQTAATVTGQGAELKAQQPNGSTCPKCDGLGIVGTAVVPGLTYVDDEVHEIQCGKCGGLGHADWMVA